MPAKKFFGVKVGLADPSDEPVVVVPNDDEDFAKGQCNYLYVGTGGDLVVQTENGGPFTYANVPNGAYIWCRATRVMEASTASDILAHY
jgi:hypothetical protein